MIPPVFEILAADPDISDLLGTSPVRVYPFGEAPEKVTRPYATYSVFNGVPENYITGRSDMDNIGTQIDVWSESSDNCNAIAETIRAALEDYAHMTGWASNERDPETQLFRTRMDFDFFKAR
jgi:hypothetical protein